MRLISFVAVAVGLLASGAAEAQIVVQQPRFRNFTVSTTVFAPDRGSVYLGGANRSGAGRYRRPYGGRSFGHAALAGGATVHTTIIDHREMDRALLAEAARRRGATHDVLGRPITAVAGSTPPATEPSSKPRATGVFAWRPRP